MDNEAARESRFYFRKMKQKIIFIVGPTGVGKTEVAVKLAEKIKAEIVSCDSMQIYTDMDILTSKPALSLRRKITHHLVSIISPDKEYNVAVYRRAALKKIKEIIKKGKVPLFVGGTGLYMSILVDGIFSVETQDNEVRSHLYEEAETLGKMHLFERLKEVDPQAASKIHPHDTKRIIRALEVYEITGKPISELQKQRSGLFDEYDVHMFCLAMERKALYKRIDTRVDKMLKEGLDAEVKKLLRLRLSKTASYAIGIKELGGYFNGACSLDEAKDLMKKNTRNYAKRQLTWFRKDKRIRWIEVGENEKPVSVANSITELL